MEWRRSFNFVSLPIKNIQVIHSCTIHEKDFASWSEINSDPVNHIKPNVKSKIIIAGLIDEDKMRDSIYFATKESKDSDIYRIGRHKGETKITVKSGDPTVKKKILQPVYIGEMLLE
ncbi:MAG: hypothetical protein IPK95_10540 [Cellvibrionales bacterium]|nr:hypothetical protein [Cellvibrionales bacterium]